MDALKKFEETIKLLENSSIYFVVAVNTEGNYVYVNKNFSRSFSYITDDFIGKSVTLDVHPDDIKLNLETVFKCFKYPDMLFPVKLRKIDGKGGYLHTQWEFKALMEDNDAVGVFCIGYKSGSEK